MKSILFLCLAAVLVSTKVNSQNILNCQKFRTGTFINIDEKGDNDVIRRTEKFQYEMDAETGSKIKLKITWIDNCTYQLEFVEGNKAWEEQVGPNFDKSLILIVTIEEVGADYYIQTAVFKGVEMVPYKSKMKLKK